MSRVVLAGAAAAILAVGLAGCGVLGDDDDGASVSGQGGGSASVADGDPGKVIVRQTVDSPVAPQAKLDIAVNGLKAEGRLAYLTLTFTPRQIGIARENLFTLNGRASVDISLIDTVNLKRYAVVKDSAGKELGPDDILIYLPEGRPTKQTYTYAAPPEGVKAMDVYIGQWPPFRNVPVGR